MTDHPLRCVSHFFGRVIHDDNDQISFRWPVSKQLAVDIGSCNYHYRRVYICVRRISSQAEGTRLRGIHQKKKTRLAATTTTHTAEENTSTAIMSMDKEYIEERVAFIVDPDQPTQFIPRISVSKTTDRVGRAKVEKTFRQFQTEDIQRVLDFENVPDPPPDGPMMHGEGPDPNSLTFPQRHVTIRGGFLFYFDLKDASGTGQSHYVTYHGPPLGVIPLEKVKVELPPGGRRVFREHAQTDARTGYELMIMHRPDAGKEDTGRPHAFIAAESLSARDKWVAAIRARSSIDSPTKLRAVAYGGGVTDPSLLTKPAEILKQKEAAKKEAAAAAAAGERGDRDRRGSSGGGMDSSSGHNEKGNKRSGGTRKGKRQTTDRSGKGDKGDGGEDAVVQEALQEFGKNNFSEKTWIDNYFETHTEHDATLRCRQMEQWQDSIKKGLKNAVLEQYEYFVEASGEMTKMGREVVDLKTLVETQLETVKEMKEIDFSTAIRDPADDNASDGGEDLFNDKRGRKGGRRQSLDKFGDDGSDLSSVSSYGDDDVGGKGGRGVSGDGPQFRDEQSKEGVIEIPSFFDDATEEIMAFVKESRYSDATELWAKAKKEVTDVMQQVRLSQCLFFFSFAYSRCLFSAHFKFSSLRCTNPSTLYSFVRNLPTSFIARKPIGQFLNEEAVLTNANVD